MVTINVPKKRASPIFRCGFLMKNEEVKFSILLTGTPEGEKQETKIVARGIIKPTLELTMDHPFIGVTWIRFSTVGRA